MIVLHIKFDGFIEAMTNKEIIKIFKQIVALMELHEENPHKVSAYQSALFKMERLDAQMKDLKDEEWERIGLSKGMQEKIRLLLDKGVLPDLEELEAKTPKGVREMLQIKGLGGKKIGVIWRELSIDNLFALQEACLKGKIADLKGFGEKTQENILEQIAFIRASQSKMRFAEAEKYAFMIENYLKTHLPDNQIFVCGELRRHMEVVSCIDLIVGTDNPVMVFALLDELTDIQHHVEKSGVFTWRGIIKENSFPVQITTTSHQDFAFQLFVRSASAKHLDKFVEGKKIYHWAKEKVYHSESEIYENMGLDYIEPEMREGDWEIDLAKNKKLPILVKMADLKGVLHNHSTYSDGRHSLEEMAVHCKELGYEYLGITDHSQTAFYANGLNVESIKKQHAEIESLNQKLAPFKIFKGIESDILADGSLDYPEEILASFDFIVASIHFGLKMSQEKATERLIKAISNPYTTILGHPTGRLLLKREGYPIDHKAVIDACAQHRVAIEINGNPYRLDLDWRWVRYALEKGVMISLNPDAHEKDAYDDMRYALLVGRKAGLTKEMTLNHKNCDEINAYFKKKRGSF
ncbi:MAG: helix-hairpin-helix domain-containing protein [Flammeovirgaceae bacterium]